MAAELSAEPSPGSHSPDSPDHQQQSGKVPLKRHPALPRAKLKMYKATSLSPIMSPAMDQKGRSLTLPDDDSESPEEAFSDDINELSRPYNLRADNRSHHLPADAIFSQGRLLATSDSFLCRPAAPGHHSNPTACSHEAVGDNSCHGDDADSGSVNKPSTVQEDN